MGYDPVVARWLSVFGLLCSFCQTQIPEGRFACDADSDCPPQMSCRDSTGRCHPIAEDAVEQDTSTDGSRLDGG